MPPFNLIFVAHGPKQAIRRPPWQILYIYIYIQYAHLSDIGVCVRAINYSVRKIFSMASQSMCNAGCQFS